MNPWQAKLDHAFQDRLTDVLEIADDENREADGQDPAKQRRQEFCTAHRLGHRQHDNTYDQKYPQEIIDRGQNAGKPAAENRVESIVEATKNIHLARVPSVTT